MVRPGVHRGTPNPEDSNFKKCNPHRGAQRATAVSSDKGTYSQYIRYCAVTSDVVTALDGLRTVGCLDILLCGG